MDLHEIVHLLHRLIDDGCISLSLPAADQTHTHTLNGNKVEAQQSSYLSQLPRQGERLTGVSDITIMMPLPSLHLTSTHGLLHRL